jgi:tetratricopeptide (TPR) repeat protein
MFLRRRGATVSPAFKRWFYLSFVLSAGLAMISIHRAASQLVFAQSASSYRVYEVLRAGIPAEWGVALAVAVGGAYVVSLVVAATLLLRAGTLRDLLEPSLLVLTQALWFALPALGAMSGAYQLLGLAFAPIWISTGHAVQYLWVTSYYANRSSPPVSTPRFIGRALLAGALLMVLPSLIFAPHVLGGQLTNYADAAVLLFAVVNLHHFLLDGAVWKLRDGRVASVLLRTDPGISGAPADAEPRSWLRPALWGMGTACLALAAYVSFALWIVRSPTMPLAEVDRANRVLAWLGKGDAVGCNQLAERHLDLGMIDHAIADYRICLDVVTQQLEREPTTLLASRLAGLLLDYQRNDPESVAEARKLARYAVRAEPENVAALELLAEAHLASGDPRRAEKTVEHAIGVARASGATERVALLERRRQALARAASDHPWPAQ